MIPRLATLCDASGLDRGLAIPLGLRLQALMGARNLEERLDAWHALQRWLGEDGKPPGTPWARLVLLLDFLERHPDAREKFQAAVAEIFGETEGVNLFAEAGMPGHRGLAAALWDRLILRFLPAPRDDHDLGKFLVRQFRDEQGTDRFRRMPTALFERVVGTLFPLDHPHLRHRLRAAFADGFRLLASKAEAQGLSADLRARSPAAPVNASPFYRLPASSDALAAAWYTGSATAAPAEAWRENAAACRRALLHIKERLETEGVSIEIVHSLTVIELSLTRMTRMAGVMNAAPGMERSGALHALFADLIEAARQDASILRLLASSTSLLHRKIVERSGSTGQHYIAGSRKEYRHIWLAAGGGGAVTTFTAAIKMGIAHLALPLFVIGFGMGLNYAVSFLILQALGLVLATKQPAMTAAHLARIVRDTGGRERKEEIAGFFAQIVRSQLAAAAGNVLVVALGATLFDAAWRLATGHGFLDPATADRVFHDLSPLNSGTVFYAALTGVLLWLASVIGGWVDNFSVYHRIPQAIRDHPMRQVLGRERLARWGDAFARNVSGWGTNVSLGFLLGLVPVFGKFLGLPLEVRHVTLSTGQLVLASASLQADWFHGGWFLRGLLGIAVMFVLNLGVSFGLSLFTAARAYRLRAGEVAGLLGEIGRHFLRRPRDFFFPPPDGAPLEPGELADGDQK